MKRCRPTTRRNRTNGRARARSEGQSLVEFALVFPVFMILIFGLIEFAFTMNAYVSLDFATRNAALVAAEAGSNDGADCSILRAIENSIGAPATTSRITEVRVFKADANGVAIGPVNVYDRTGTTSCPLSDGTAATMPYQQVSSSYPPDSRCDELEGCKVQTSVDTIGVQVSYDYGWTTPLHSLLPMSGNGYMIVKANAMRMEPVL